MKKAVEVSSATCQVLVIVKLEQQWYEYSSSPASALFFGLQAAKEQLQEVETWTQQFRKNLPEVSPPPTKKSRVPMRFKKQTLLTLPVQSAACVVLLRQALQNLN